MVAEWKHLGLGNWILGYLEPSSRELRTFFATLVQIEISYDPINTSNYSAYPVCDYPFAVCLLKSQMQ
jgi:hypothetical protein